VWRIRKSAGFGDVQNRSLRRGFFSPAMLAAAFAANAQAEPRVEVGMMICTLSPSIG
jgi:hypothetical protein